MYPVQEHLMFSIEKEMPGDFVKQRFPLRPGKYSEIRTQDYEFGFTLNGEIQSIRGLRPDWPHPAEMLRRTAGNDWVYYTVGDKSGDQGIISWMGEYYLPCLPYPSNPVWEINYFSNPVIMAGMAAWSQLFGNLYMADMKGAYPHAAGLIRQILAMDDRTLFQRAEQLHAVLGHPVSVLPPDTRHVDYRVIPLTIADGCLYHCKFCCVKSESVFQKRSREGILEQISGLAALYGRDMENYHALFLGNHDALAAGRDLIEFAATTAYKAFGFRPRAGQPPYLFLFGSVDSFLSADQDLYNALERLPFYTIINIGLESVDPHTLARIGKPVSADKVGRAFEKLLAINDQFRHIEITGNFIAGQDLPPAHADGLTALLDGAASGRKGAGKIKGAVYLSPLKDSPKKRELLPWVYEIKSQSPLPVFVYLIQRL